jgi:hypothetical protein
VAPYFVNTLLRAATACRYCVPLPPALSGRLSAGQIAVPPEVPPTICPPPPQVNFFGRLFSPKKTKIAAKKRERYGKK